MTRTIHFLTKLFSNLNRLSEGGCPFKDIFRKRHVPSVHSFRTLPGVWGQNHRPETWYHVLSERRADQDPRYFPWHHFICVLAAAVSSVISDSEWDSAQLLLKTNLGVPRIQLICEARVCILIWGKRGSAHSWHNCKNKSRRQTSYENPKHNILKRREGELRGLSHLTTCFLQWRWTLELALTEILVYHISLRWCEGILVAFF